MLTDRGPTAQYRILKENSRRPPTLNNTSLYHTLGLYLIQPWPEREVGGKTTIRKAKHKDNSDQLVQKET